MKEPFLEHKIYFDEYITGNRFIDICQDLGIIFCKTDYLNSFSNLKCKVFVTHNSDYHICESRERVGPECDHWYAQNKDTQQDKIISLPIGIENMKRRGKTPPDARPPSPEPGDVELWNNWAFSSQISGALEKALLMDKISSLKLPKTGLVYMNFNTKTHPTRPCIWSLLEKKNWINKTSNLQMQKFYFDIASHKFVISPRGNGVDCHRTWEALYLRTIPIVERSTHMNEFSDLPIFFVNSWDEICYNKLNKFYKKVENELFNLDKMKISYWRKAISEKLSV